MRESASACSTQIPRLNELADSGFVDERILFLVFERLKWDLHTLCRTASVSCKLRALAKRLLWRELCLHRAPRMISALTEGSSNKRIIGGWQALAKLLFFCGGCEPTRHFNLSRPSPGHFVKSARFSKTSGRSFLTRKCRGDVLYVSDPCEHPNPAGDGKDEVGIYRGIFRSFTKSRTREFLIMKQVDFEVGVRCPYCRARVWSMTAARMISRKSVALRLGSSHDTLEYFVCLNGHLHGACWLAHLSSDGEFDDDGDEGNGHVEEDANCMDSEDEIPNGNHMKIRRGKI